MARYTNKDHTQAESQGWHDTPERLIELGYLEKSELIEPYSEPPESALLSELALMDLPLWKLELAIAGDDRAKQDVAANEKKKNEIRKKLADLQL